MSSLVHCFSAISGSIREKTKMDINGYHSDVKYVFELWSACPGYWWRKVNPAYCHFKKEGL